MSGDYESRIKSVLAGNSPDLFKISSAIGDILDQTKGTEADIESRLIPIRMCLDLHDVGDVSKELKGYGPRFQIPNEDGTVSIYPHPEKFTEDIIKSASEQVGEIENHFIRARILDVIWCITSEFDFARRSLEEYDRALCAPKDLETLLHAGRAAGRMYRLATLLNQDESRVKAVNLLLDIAEEGLNTDGIGIVLRPINSLINQGKRLSDEQAARTIEILQKGLRKEVDEGDPFGQTDYLEATAGLRKLQGESEESEVSMREVAESLEKRAAIDPPPSPLIRTAWLEDALEIYRKINDQENVSRLQRMIQDIGPEVVANLSTISTPFEIPRELIDTLEEQVRSFESVEIAIREVVAGIDALPMYEEALRVAAESRADHPLLSLLNKTLVDEKGPIAHIDDENREKYDAYQQMDIFLKVNLLTQIEPSFRALEDLEMGTSDALGVFHEEGVLLSEETIQFISAGVSEYFHGHFTAACTLLLLAIEPVLRDLVERFSALPTITYKKGYYSSITLGRTLNLISRHPALLEAFDKQVIDFLQWFVGDPLGANYRNRIAHGLMNVESLGQPLAAFLVWLHWNLAQYRIRSV